jgi:hypothetical protein
VVLLTELTCIRTDSLKLFQRKQAVFGQDQNGLEREAVGP